MCSVDNWFAHEVIQAGYRDVVDGTEAVVAVHVNHNYKRFAAGISESICKGVATATSCLFVCLTWCMSNTLLVPDEEERASLTRGLLFARTPITQCRGRCFQDRWGRIHVLDEGKDVRLADLPQHQPGHLLRQLPQPRRHHRPRTLEVGCVHGANRHVPHQACSPRHLPLRTQRRRRHNPE